MLSVGLSFAKCRPQLPAAGCEHRAWFPSRLRCAWLPSPSEKHFCLHLSSTHLRTSGFQPLTRAFLKKAPNGINEELLFVAVGQQGSARSPREVLVPGSICFVTALPAQIALAPARARSPSSQHCSWMSSTFPPLPFLSPLPTSLPPSLPGP